MGAMAAYHSSRSSVVVWAVGVDDESHPLGKSEPIQNVTKGCNLWAYHPPKKYPERIVTLIL